MFQNGVVTVCGAIFGGNSAVSVGKNVRAAALQTRLRALTRANACQVTFWQLSLVIKMSREFENKRNDLLYLTKSDKFA